MKEKAVFHKARPGMAGLKILQLAVCGAEITQGAKSWKVVNCTACLSRRPVKKAEE